MNKNQELAEYLRKWRLSDARRVAASDWASVWKVRREDGSLAALKLPKGRDKADEGGADDAYACFGPETIAQCLESDAGGWLIEWIDGPSLGEKARGGELENADAELIALCGRMHSGRFEPNRVWRTLEAQSEPLQRFEAAKTGSADGEAAVRQAQKLRTHLLDTAPAPRLLHGDYHHDNVALSSRGWLAFDPKGIMGDLAYEPANSFRNPLGCDDAWRDPARVERLADGYADALGCDRRRILQWSAVHAALSMVWAADDGAVDAFNDLPVLSLLLDAAE
ncbi:MAG: phosphotransferase [Rhodobacteraceae bacterium]|nr:phosphotransferase [Paracoccaceae bacterium]